MSFVLYLVGTLVVLGGVLYAEHLAHIPQRWVVVTALIILGGGILSGVAQTRQKDPQ